MSRRLLPLLLSPVLLCMACDRTPSFRHNQERRGKPVVTFADDSVTAEELHQRFAEMSPSSRARYQTLDQKKEYLDGILRFELLATEAINRGLLNDPDVMETAKKVMVQKLLQQQLEGKTPPVTDAELRDYYEKHLTDYVRPEMVRLSHVFLAAPPGDAAARTQKHAQAETVLTRVKALDPMDFAAFGKVAREQSEEPRTRPLDGDMRYLSEQELQVQYGPEVAAAARALARSGDLSRVVEAERGLHILKLQGRQAALNLKLEDVKPQLQNRIQYEHRMQAHERLIEELKKKYHVEVDDRALAAVQVDLKAPAREAQSSAPGFVPPPPPRPAAPVPPLPPPALPARAGESRAPSP